MNDDFRKTDEQAQNVGSDDKNRPASESRGGFDLSSIDRSSSGRSVDRNFDEEPEQRRASARNPAARANPRRTGGQKLDAKGKPKHKKKRSWLRVTIWVSVIVILSVGLTFGAVYTFKEVMGLNMADDVIITIEQEDNTTEKIAKRLQEKGVIKNALMFRLFSKLKSADGTYKYGTFTLKANTDYSGIIEQLQKDGVQANTVKVLVREGAGIDAILNIVERSGVCSKADFREAMNDYKNANLQFLREIPEDRVYYRLEGYIYPATYDALQIKEWKDSLESRVESEQTASKATTSSGTSSASGSLSSELAKDISAFYTKNSKDSKSNAKNLINAMLMKTQNMLNYTSTEYPTSAYKFAEQSGYNIHQIMTMASIIEAESGASTENMPKVSAVFFNRINWKTEPPLLGSDPTMIYAEKVKNKYYDTRKEAGWPPGPINSPSIQAIMAACNPDPEFKDAKYYFLTDNEGNFYYFKTYNEHVNKKNELIKKGKWY